MDKNEEIFLWIVKGASEISQKFVILPQAFFAIQSCQIYFSHEQIVVEENVLRKSIIEDNIFYN